MEGGLLGGGCVAGYVTSDFVNSVFSIVVTSMASSIVNCVIISDATKRGIGHDRASAFTNPLRLMLLRNLNAPVVLELLAYVVVKVSADVLLVSCPGLGQPILIVMTELETLNITSTVVPKIVVVAKRLDVRAGLVCACIQDLRVIRETSQDLMLLFLGENFPSPWEEKEVLSVMLVSS